MANARDYLESGAMGLGVQGCKHRALSAGWGGSLDCITCPFLAGPFWPFLWFPLGVSQKVPKHAEHHCGNHKETAFWRSVGAESLQSCFKRNFACPLSRKG